MKNKIIIINSFIELFFIITFISVIVAATPFRQLLLRIIIIF